MFKLNQFKSILCLNGDLPLDFLNKFKLPIFAADGAANCLMKIDIKPELVIGDLDSVLPEYLNQLNSHYHLDQNYCDFEKSLQYLKNKDLLPTIVLGMNGGFIDHILNNVNCFMQSHAVFYAEPIFGFIMQQNTTQSLTLPLQSKISLIGMPNAVISSQGLQWELDRYSTTFPGKNSCFNCSIHQNVEVTIHSGNALILIYTKSLGDIFKKD